VADWAHSLGYRVRLHDGFPGDDPDHQGRYIAIGPAGRDRYRHVVAVMNGYVFDPGSGFRLPGWMRREPFRSAEFSVNFEKE
jgi:hypothetical protein